MQGGVEIFLVTNGTETRISFGSMDHLAWWNIPYLYTISLFVKELLLHIQREGNREKVGISKTRSCDDRNQGNRKRVVQCYTIAKKNMQKTGKKAGGKDNLRKGEAGNSNTSGLVIFCQHQDFSCLANSMPTYNQDGPVFFFPSHFPLLCNPAAFPPQKMNFNSQTSQLPVLVDNDIILFCCSHIYTQSIFHFPAELVQGTAFQSCVLKTDSLVCCMCLLAEITEGNQDAMVTVGAWISLKDLHLAKEVPLDYAV